MEIKCQKEGEYDVIVISGRLDTTTSEDLLGAVNPFFEKEKANVIFECGEMEYISSSGLRIFLTAHKGIVAKGGTFVVRNLTPEVQSVMNLTGFSRILTIR